MWPSCIFFVGWANMGEWALSWVCVFVVVALKFRHAPTVRFNFDTLTMCCGGGGGCIKESTGLFSPIC